MSTSYLALLSATPKVGFSEIQRVAQALQRQLTEHLTPLWGQVAAIMPVQRLEDVPFYAAPIIVCERVGNASEFGFHKVDRHDPLNPTDDQPFALVEYQKDWWPFDASHECLEIIMDPFGNAVLPGFDPTNRGLAVSYLVEICDPCGRRDAHYSIDGVPVCDFHTPRWFDASPRPGESYSHQKKLRTPRSLLPGGYTSYYLPVTPGLPGAEGWYMTAFDGQSYETVRIPTPDINGSLREGVDAVSEAFLAKDADCRSTRTALRRAAPAYRLARRAATQRQRTVARNWRRTLGRV